MQINKSKHCPAFNLVSEDGKNVKIVMGNSLISERTFESEAKAEFYIKSKPYELIFNASIIFTQWTIKELNNENKEQKHLDETRDTDE